LHLGVEFLSLRCPGDDPPCKLSGMVSLTAALLDVLDAAEVTVDGFSDCNELPTEAKAALADLQAMALVEHEREAESSRWYRRLRRDGPTNMGITFDPRVAGRHIVEQFGPYSINTEVRDTEGRLIFDLHDSGSSVWVETFTPDHDSAVTDLLRQAEVAFVLRP
jgi:hypothetical protein